jgi:hypothetical protein
MPSVCPNPRMKSTSARGARLLFLANTATLHRPFLPAIHHVLRSRFVIRWQFLFGRNTNHTVDSDLTTRQKRQSAVTRFVGRCPLRAEHPNMLFQAFDDFDAAIGFAVIVALVLYSNLFMAYGKLILTPNQ